jgi:aspartate aminotransferase
MPNLARRATEINPSPTIAMNARAAEMKRLGKDIIPLSLGEPDFHTPDNIKAAGIAAIERNFTKYTNADGYAPLRKAIAEKLRRDNNATYTPEQVVVGGGAKIVILSAILNIVNPGDEVVIPTPYWVTYPDHVEMAGGKSVFAPCDESTGFKLTAETLASVLTPRTRAFIFNSPNNPSGAVYSADEIRALAAVLAKYPDVWIVTDELYEHLVFDSLKTTTFIEAVPEFADRIITINGFSKGYVMTGWRLAFAAGPRPVIKAIGDLLSSMTGAPNSIAQAAAIAALEGDQSFMERNRRTFQERRDVVVARANSMPGLSALKPSGTFYVFVNCSKWLGRTSAGGYRMDSDVEVVEALLNEAEVATVPGSVFGCSPFFRISISLEVPMIEEGLNRIEKFAKGIK